MKIIKFKNTYLSPIAAIIAHSALLMFFVTCAKESPEPIVARAGKTTIPLSEFRDRYQFTPHIMQTKDKFQNRRNAVASMLGEKLLAEEAYHRNLDDKAKYNLYVDQMQKEAMVEALFDHEISSTIEITEQEIKQGYIRSQSELTLQVLTFDSLQAAQQAREQIETGKSLNAVKREFQTETFISADSVLTLPMKWGQAHPSLEDAAYTLGMNQVSQPIYADGSYFILKLIDKKSNVFLSEADYQNQAPSIQKTIRQRKRTQKFYNYMKTLMKDKEVKVSHQMFDLVASELEKVYPIGSNRTADDSTQIFREFTLEALQRRELSDIINEPFARFEDGSEWTVQDFITKLSIGPYKISYKSKNAFRNSLSRAMKSMVEFESLAQKGKELGLDETYYVQYQTKMWADSYLAMDLRQSIIDTITVTDAEVQAFYHSHQNNYTGPAMVNIQEILVDNKKLADEIYQRIQAGEDIAALARVYNTRELSKKKDGISGYFAASALGKIGEAAKALKIGDISRPVATETGEYSVFKVLDKRDAGPLSLAQVQADVQTDALHDKRIRTIDNFLLHLADKYHIEVNQSVLDSLQTTDSGMLVLKQHYYKRQAAPFVTPLNNSHQWQNLMDTVYPLKPQKK
ncbi:MAG: peptidyl-prolyl cis-trans isomerase [Candidatus Zhuqueibacterota bacterium]